MKKYINIFINIILIILAVIIVYLIYSNIKEKNKEPFDLGEVTKDEFFIVIDKGINKSPEITVFMYSKEILDDDSLIPISFEDEYSKVLEDIDFFQYKNENFEFQTYKHTDEYIWGYFFEEGKIDEKTNVIVDKSTGILKALNKPTLQLIIY